MGMSLHILSKAMKRKIITLIGKLDEEEMLIWVDIGSSNSYISGKKGVTFDIPYQLVDLFLKLLGIEPV